MVKLAPIDSPIGQFFVEIVEIETQSNGSDTTAQFPEGAEQISALDHAVGGFDRARELLTQAAGIVTKAIEEHRPDEAEVEISLGFGGNAGVPYIVSGTAEAGIRVRLAWYKHDLQAQSDEH